MLVVLTMIVDSCVYNRSSSVAWLQLFEVL